MVLWQGGERIRDFLSIGSSPCDEPCAQVGQADYFRRARDECRRFIELLRRRLGPEPEGARLEIKSFAHDFDDYLEVVCSFDTDDEDAVAYALRCEAEAPATWEG